MDALSIWCSFVGVVLLTWVTYTLCAMAWRVIPWNPSARTRMAPNGSPSPLPMGFRQFVLLGDGAALLAVTADRRLMISAAGRVYLGSAEQLRLLCEVWPAALSSPHADPDIERPAASQLDGRQDGRRA